MSVFGLFFGKIWVCLGSVFLDFWYVKTIGDTAIYVQGDLRVCYKATYGLIVQRCTHTAGGQTIRTCRGKHTFMGAPMFGGE